MDMNAKCRVGASAFPFRVQHLIKFLADGMSGVKLV